MADTKKALSTLMEEITQWVSINEPLIVQYHQRISEQWKANKDRNLATVESAVRGIGTDIERLSIAVPKVGSDKVSDASNGSKFAKPR